MLTVYVQHYLTAEGMNYFKNHWFSKVHSIISQQKGFISITYKESLESSGRVDITLKFKDEESLNAWVLVPIHDELIDLLDA